ncbi:unnamed protein product, partial [Ascophyllum nodosum]
MKLCVVTASLCVLGSVSAFVVPVSIRSGESRFSFQQSSSSADQTKAREALIDSPGMEELLKMIGSGSEDEPEEP